jgi:N-acetylmuramoyl-L-alanine amidase CwlA
MVKAIGFFITIKKIKGGNNNMGKIISTGMISATINGIKVNTSKKAHSSNYNNNSSRTVNYIVMHYTGNSKDTAPANANYFQGANRQASAHFFVDNTSIYQSVELRDTAWHCGGSTYYHKYCRNSNAIGIEMCCTAGDYKISSITIKNSAYLCAYLCKMLNITAKEVDLYVLRHYDVTHKKCPAQMVDNSAGEDKDWVAFKKQVKELLGGTITKSEGTKEVYRIRKSWTNVNSQIGAYSVLENAKKACDKAGKDYSVYNNKGEKLYPKTTSSSTSFKVRVNCDVLNVRAGAGTSYRINTKVKRGEVYTIVEQKNGWGKLKSGAGWIKLSYTLKA